jgi:hypothetical protein
MRRFLISAALCLAPFTASSEDFAFFKLIKDGRVAKEDVASHCQTPPARVRALSTASLNLKLDLNHERVRYVDRQFTNLSFSPGQWTGEVYKAVCPGLYNVTVDFIATDKDGATAGDVTVHIHTWRKAALPDMPAFDKPMVRPGELSAVAFKAGPAPKGTGHAQALVALGTGDEISTHSLSSDGKPRFFERVQLNIALVQHMPELARDVVNAEFEADRAESEKVRFAP